MEKYVRREFIPSITASRHLLRGFNTISVPTFLRIHFRVRIAPRRHLFLLFRSQQVLWRALLLIPGLFPLRLGKGLRTRDPRGGSAEQRRLASDGVWCFQRTTGVFRRKSYIIRVDTARRSQ